MIEVYIKGNILTIEVNNETEAYAFHSWRYDWCTQIGRKQLNIIVKKQEEEKKED